MKVRVAAQLDELESLIRAVKNSSDEIGAILIFIGVVRGKTKKGRRVLRLDYEAHPNLAQRRLEHVLKEVIAKYGIIDAIAEHKIGSVNACDDIMYVVVASKHRAEGFKALVELVNRIKSEVPIWKKEVTENGSYWVRD